MSARAHSSLRSLAERYPEVAATWDVGANEFGPAEVAAQAGLVAHWRCARGHRWREKVQQRVKLDQWKQGRRDACRVCTGYWIETNFACGHVVAVARIRARPERLCPDCWAAEKERREATWEKRKREGSARAAELKPECKADARIEADRLWQERGYARLPELLQRPARSALASKLTFSLIGERAFGNPPAPQLLGLLNELDSLAARAVDQPDCEHAEPLEVFGTRFWPPALASGSCAPAPTEPETVAEIEAAAAEALRLGGSAAGWLAFEMKVTRAYDDPEAEAATWALTAVVIDALKAWAYKQGWRSWRELHVPLPDERSTGRLDLVVFRPGRPDIVIELDSRNVPRSIAKLELARDRGALPIWLRFGRGRTIALSGVHAIDLTEPAVLSSARDPAV
jgi:hypothetical protein